jgi:hypothetical protein
MKSLTIVALTLGAAVSISSAVTDIKTTGTNIDTVVTDQGYKKPNQVAGVTGDTHITFSAGKVWADASSSKNANLAGAAHDLAESYRAQFFGFLGGDDGMQKINFTDSSGSTINSTVKTKLNGVVNNVEKTIDRISTNLTDDQKAQYDKTFSTLKTEIGTLYANLNKVDANAGAALMNKVFSLLKKALADVKTSKITTATLSAYDKQLPTEAQGTVVSAQKSWTVASSANNTSMMDASHEVAESVRALYGNYSGGSTGYEKKSFDKLSGKMQQVKAHLDKALSSVSDAAGNGQLSKNDSTQKTSQSSISYDVKTFFATSVNMTKEDALMLINKVASFVDTATQDIK